MHDRQVRAFGKAGQQALQRLRVAVVGLGGTGSFVTQELAHLGVSDFLLIDPDSVESSNLNRLVGSTQMDVGAPKVDVAARLIRSIVPTSQVEAIVGDVIKARTAQELTNVDMIFGCTDSHGSRAVLQQVGYQYLIPIIDMGVTIAVVDSRITHVYGRVQLLSPGLPCFHCSHLLDSEQVRRDMMTAFERQSDPYIPGAAEPAPAVISLNGTVASLAITMLLSTVAGVPGSARHILYNAMKPALRSIGGSPEPTCYICSRTGALAKGDEWPLQARRD